MAVAGTESATLEEEMRAALASTLRVEKELAEVRKLFKDKYVKPSRRQVDALKGLKEQHVALTKETETKLPGAITRLQKSTRDLKQAQEDREKQVNATVETQSTDTEELEAFLHRTRDVLEIRSDPGRELLTPPVTLPMDRFEERKENNETWTSPEFYSHHYGYKMCLQVYPNGNDEGRGTHVSVYVSILPGEFDDILPWPFCGYVTVHLVNQRRGKTHFHRTVELNTEATLHIRARPDPLRILEPGQSPSWGYHSFARDICRAPADTEYLKEDTLTFRVWKVDLFNVHH